jgi:polar amino acid transport system substrate-binding protein
MIDAGARTRQTAPVAVTFRSVCLVAIALLVTVGCAPAAQAPAPQAGAACQAGGLPTLKAGTLTFGTDQPVYPPWFVDDKPESGQGFEGAIAAAIADGLGYPKDKVTWVRVPFNAAVQPGPKTYDLDLNEFSITDERKQAVDFSSPYYDVKQAVVALNNSPVAGATSIGALKSAKLGAQVGTTSLDAVTNQIAPTTRPSVFNSNDDAKLALTNGQIDALVVDLPTAFYITSAELQNAKIVGQLPAGSGTPEQFGAVLDKGSALTTCVSQAVDKLRSAGTLTALEKQWLSTAGSAPELT